MSPSRDRLLSPSFQATLVPQLRCQLPSVKLVILFGSQATGRAHTQSDWDIAILAEASPWDVFLMQRDIADLLKLCFDDLDLVIINHCSPLLGFNISRDGQCLYEAEPGLFQKFTVRAWKRFWDTAKFRKLQDKYIRETAESILNDFGRSSNGHPKAKADFRTLEHPARD
ncbi:MAG: nucleotidyltransferase domain-containing protein [Cyanobacteria bacterium P01_A01_bin.105]